jgi:hypothetical protein
MTIGSTASHQECDGVGEAVWISWPADRVLYTFFLALVFDKARVRGAWAMHEWMEGRNFGTTFSVFDVREGRTGGEWMLEGI